jgi:hypothetical protein
VAPKSYRRLGADLALTRFIGEPGPAVSLSAADSWGSLDLQLLAGGRTGRNAAAVDFGSVSGRQNLAQAIMLRLLTRQGALAPLGHPQYGSRLLELIGGENSESNRNRARLYTLSALQQEARIAKILDLVVDPVPGQPETLRISFSVVPLDDDAPLTLELEVVL